MGAALHYVNDSMYYDRPAINGIAAPVSWRLIMPAYAGRDARRFFRGQSQSFVKNHWCAAIRPAQHRRQRLQRASRQILFRLLRR